MVEICWNCDGVGMDNGSPCVVCIGVGECEPIDNRPRLAAQLRTHAEEMSRAGKSKAAHVLLMAASVLKGECDVV